MFRWDDGRALPPHGRFVPPTMIRLAARATCRRRCSAGAARRALRPAKLDALLDDVAGNGTGMTLGIQYPHYAVAEKRIVARLSNGNVLCQPLA